MSGDLQTLAEASHLLLQHAGLDGRQGNVLLIKNPALAWPESSCLERNQASFDRAIHLDLGAGTERFCGLTCSTAELPFLEAAFRRVVLWHVIADGGEPELAEALRVLDVGGELVILGVQQSVLPALNAADPGAQANRPFTVPRLQRRRVLHRLRESGIEQVTVTGSGLPLSRNWAVEQAGLAGILLPFASLLMVRARHANPDLPSLLRPGRFAAPVARATEAAALFIH